MMIDLNVLKPVNDFLGKKRTEECIRRGSPLPLPYESSWNIYCTNNASSRVNDGFLGVIDESSNGEMRKFSKSKILTAKYEGKTIGVAWAHPPRSVPPPIDSPWVPGKKYFEQQFHVSVDKSFEGQGVGKTLVEHIEKILEENVVPVCKWNPEYERPVRFFKNLGFDVFHNEARKTKN
ncbi:MAG: GNAT family N-acetyltransferase [Nanoarchaeota archaeon]|nr:GNAT family N-acetyltransferase [Nanoarchaeota archaeon]